MDPVFGRQFWLSILLVADLFIFRIVHGTVLESCFARPPWEMGYTGDAVLPCVLLTNPALIRYGSFKVHDCLLPSPVPR